jgi:4-diphosphocytidyl-2-C-methyl-D-erythritol kinase
MSLLALHDVAAPAKLNLFLHVVGRRPDGYHLLQSVFTLIDWCDTLHFELRRDGQLARHDLSAALPADDLSRRAARLLQQSSGCTLGVDISIDKVIPWGAGLGGGSSDAASTLLALNQLWGLHWPLARLMSLGLQLGADVPFFLGGTNALVQGIGEQLTPVAIAPHWFAVIKPAVNIETRTIFASPLLVNRGNPDIVENFTKNAIDNVVDLSWGRNDLQEAAEAQCAEVREVGSFLQQHYGNSRMTGSGSAVFARAGGGLKPNLALPLDLGAGWVSKMCQSLVQHPLANWADVDKARSW